MHPNRFSLSQFILRYYNKLLIAIEIIADAIAIFLAFQVSLTVFLYYHQPVISYKPQITIIATVTTLIGIVLFERIGLYRRQVSLMNLIEIRKIIRAVSLLCLGLIIYSYSKKIVFPRSLLSYIFFFMMLFVLLERMFFFKMQQLLYIRKINVRRILILGAGEKGKLLYQNIAQAPKFGYYVIGFIDNNTNRLKNAQDWYATDQKNNLLFCSEISRLVDIVSTHKIAEIIISNPLHSLGEYDLQKLANLCQKLDLKLNFVPHVIPGYYVNQLQSVDINGIPMITLNPIQISHAEQLSKRAFDLSLSIASLILLSPLFLIIALLIRIDSKGPIFFSQTRICKNGKSFQMYKFRSMHIDSPAYTNSPTSSDDPRITNIGRFLRKTSLDELPQLLNVILGQMSLVGPRPEMPFIVENEYEAIDYERLRVKPGITGVWQISTDRTREIHENISYDIFYIQNRSFLLDVIIIIRTLISGIMLMRTH